MHLTVADYSGTEVSSHIEMYPDGINLLTDSLTYNGNPIALQSDIPTISGTNDGTNWTSLTIGSNTYNIGGSSGGTWGSITGTLSTQTDLQSALNSKLSTSGGTMDGNLTISYGSAIRMLDIYGTATTRYTVSGIEYPDNGQIYWSLGKYPNKRAKVLRAGTLPAAGTTDTILLPDGSGTLALQSEVSAKQDASTAYNTSNIVYSSTEPSNPTTGMIWLKPIA